MIKYRCFLENYYEIIIKKGEINLGENYVFNLKRLSVNETGSDKFEVEFQISGISHNGVYDT